MSSPSTLYSKLKILVAKLYKAEKLYNSMRRLPVSESQNQHHKNSNSYSSPNSFIQRRLEKKLNGEFTNDSNSQSLIEHANDVRSSEWHKVHQSFRVKLNDLLTSGNNPNLPLGFNNLWLEFLAEFEVAELDPQECNESSKEALNKEEYSYLFKLSLELIRRKARLQALKVIHDELDGLLHSNSQKNSSNFASLSDVIISSKLNNVNVIPLKRKIAN